MPYYATIAARRQDARYDLTAGYRSVGTITFGGDDFIRSVKQRPDMELTEVTSENRDLLPDVIIGKISELLGPAGQGESPAGQ